MYIARTSLEQIYNFLLPRLQVFVGQSDRNDVGIEHKVKARETKFDLGLLTLDTDIEYIEDDRWEDRLEDRLLGWPSLHQQSKVLVFPIP